MEKRAEQLLRLIGLAIKDKTFEETMTEEADYAWIYEQASRQHLSPLLYEAVHKSAAQCNIPDGIEAEFSMDAMDSIIRQTKKTAEFLHIYQVLCKAGIKVLVLKGIICRDLYGEYADYRESGDEDLWIAIEDYAACEKILAEHGYEQQEGEITEHVLHQMQEVTFYHEETGLALELHINLMGENTPMARQMNKALEGAFDKVWVTRIQGEKIYSLTPTNHFIFLLLHFMKHFISLGIGIRQMLDLVLFAERYESQIQWEKIGKVVSEFRMERLMSDLFYIGETYLGIHAPVRAVPVNPERLVEDMLESGIYGKGTKAHELASQMTMAQFHKGKGGFAFTVLFPSRDRLKQQYPVLYRHPWALPAIWIKRIVKLIGYYGSQKGRGDTIAEESIHIGKQRIVLLETYNMIQ